MVNFDGSRSFTTCLKQNYYTSRQGAVGLHPVPGLAQLGRQTSAAQARMFGDESADEDEIVFGNWAVAVTERLGHGRQDSGAGYGTQAGENASQIVKVPQRSRCDQTHGHSSSLTGGTP